MKRSNIHSLILLSVITGLFLFTRFTYRSSRYIGAFTKKINVLYVEDSLLQPSHIRVDPLQRPLTGCGISYLEKYKADSTYIYYVSPSGQSHMPTHFTRHDTLHIGTPRPETGCNKLVLRINGLQTILLNGTPVWTTPDNGNPPEENSACP